MNIAIQKPRYGHNYAPGYFGFVIRRKDFIAAGIRWFSRWDSLPSIPAPSHAFVIGTEDTTIEAFGSGVAYGSLQAYLDDQDVALIVRRPARWTPKLGDAIVEQAATHIGERYGYGLIAAHALSNTYAGHLLTKLTRGWFERKVVAALDSRRAEICSELVARAAQDADPGLALRGCLVRDAAEIKPADLFFDRECCEPADYACELVRG